MSKSKTTRHALFASATALLLCVVMLIGTTFAWFTDTASTNVKKIQSGTLNVELLDENNNSVEGQTLTWQKAAEGAGQEVLWEPGATYNLQSFKIKNNGNLALKYKISISGITGDNELKDAITWTYTLADGTAFDISAEGHLAAGKDTGLITISGKMLETAGNEYQGKYIDGVAITVVATQDTVEYDSNNNTYDAGAEFPVTVGTYSELKETLNSLKSGDSVVIVASDNIEVTETSLTIPENTTVVLDMGGNSLGYSGITASLAPVVNEGNLTVRNATIYSEDELKTDDTKTSNCALKNTGGTLVLENCTLRNKSGKNSSSIGGSYCLIITGGEVSMTNCEVNGYRGGIAVGGDAVVTASNCTFIGRIYYPVYVHGTSTSTFTNCTFNKSPVFDGQGITGGRGVIYNYLNAESGEEGGSAVFDSCAFTSTWNNSKTVYLEVINNTFEYLTFTGNCTYSDNINTEAGHTFTD